MMVLKRVFLTALGAVGLGALVSGTAFAQQIPAPGLYTNVLKCQNGVGEMGTGKAVLPKTLTGLRKDATESVVDSLLKGTSGVALDQAGAFMTIGSANNYGGLTTRASPCANDDPVGDGFSDAERLERAAYTRRPLPGADPSEAYRDALAARDEYGGPVYTALYEEVAAKRAVESAIKEWNALFLDATTTADTDDEDGAYRAALSDYRGVAINNLRDQKTAFEDTGSGDSAVTAAEHLAASKVRAYGGMGNAQGFRQILNADSTAEVTLTDGAAGSGGFLGSFVISGDSATSFSDTTFNSGLDSMFDDSGNLRLAKVTGTGASATPPAASARLTSIGNISDELGNWNALISRQEKQIADRKKNGLSTTADDDRLVKMKAVQLHVQGELERLLRAARDNFHGGSDLTGTTALADDLATSEETIRSYNTALDSLRNVDEAVRSAVTTFENARTQVFDRLTDTGTYLQQLEALRQWEFDNASEAEQNNQKSSVNTNLAAAMKQRQTHEMGADPDNPATTLRDALLVANGKAGDDDGQALLNAISANYQAIKDVADDVPDALDTTAITDNTMKIGENADDITALDGRVAANESDIGQIQTDLYGDTSGQHGDLAACDATGLLNVANCADARSRHNEADIEEVNDKLMQKKEYIDNLAAEIGVDPVTGEGTGEGGMSRIDMNAAAIDAEEMARMEADTMLGGRIDAEEMARMEADTALGMRIDTNAGDIMTNAGNIMSNEMAIGANAGNITSNANAIASNMNAIGQNRSAISDNRNMIGELSDDLEVVRAGVAASMALAGMPAINGRGIAIGVGSYDGESAFAVGFQIQGEQASFKVGVTSSGGETGASAGVGFNF